MSNQKVLLHLGTYEDADYQGRLAGLSAGLQVSWKSRLSTPGTIAELEMQCKAANVSGVVCSNQQFLEKLLHAQSDFTPPNNRRGITLDDYQGSLLHTPRDNLPVVIINPLANLITVPWATPAARRFVKKIAKPSDWFPQTKFNWQVATPANLPEIYQRWKNEATIISVDIETPIPNPLRTINCVGYCAYFPRTHTTECIVIPFTDVYFLEWIRKFNRLEQPKIFQNGLYDNLYFLRFNAPCYNWLHDTQHLFHSWYSEFPKRLDFITAFALRNIRYWKDDGKTGNITDYYRYNAQDCWATLNAYLSLLSECDDFALRNYVMEFPLVFPCLTCEVEGLAVDMERFATVKAEKEQKLVVAIADFQKMIAADNFNVASPKQMKNLFTVLGCDFGSTDKAATLKAQAAHPLNNRILSASESIKKDKKLISTYFVEDKLWYGRIYYKLNPAGTDTARLASSESSYWCGFQIQNFPRGDSFKQVVIADNGWLLCEIDKAQSEARCVGYLSGEEKLIKLVESDKDYHSWNASAFFGIAYEEIWDPLAKGGKGKAIDTVVRDLSKRTNHGANYNMGKRVMLDTMGPKLVSTAKVTLKLKGSLLDVCQYLLDVYEKTYPKVKGIYYDSIISRIERTGKLVSPLGWTRIFFAKPSKQNKPALNAAVAHEPQNLSVAIINEEFYNVWHCQIYGNYYSNGVRHEYDLRGLIRIKAQIHDSIFFQYKETKTPAMVEALMQTKVSIVGADGITRIMLIPSDISAGKNRWSELK